MKKKNGFTLLELLVVVLIIGVLAAIALPQYKYAVAKSKFVQLKTAIKTLKDAETRYLLTTGKTAWNLKNLDIEIQGGTYKSESFGSGDTIKFDWGKCKIGGDNDYKILVCNLNDPKINYFSEFDSETKYCCAHPESGEIGKRLCQEEFPNSVGQVTTGWCGTNGIRYKGQ